jgi:hypothetical protein
MIKMLSLLKAEQLVMSGRSHEAVPLLRQQIDGKEPFQIHVGLRDALLAAGEKKQALAENEWLASRRGLAYIEPIGGLVFQATNVADSNLAILRTTEILSSMGQEEMARQKADTFRRTSQQQSLPSYLALRLVATEPASKQ